MFYKTIQVKEITKLLIDRKIGILPTDTVYGLHCLSFDNDLNNRIYEIKNRPESKQFISIISNTSHLELHGVLIDNFIKEQIEKFWPGPNTLILTDRDGVTHALRWPKNEFLNSIVNETGPLISTSANLHGQPVLNDVRDCFKTFGDKVDFYVDGGVLNNNPSSIYKFDDNTVIKIR